MSNLSSKRQQFEHKLDELIARSDQPAAPEDRTPSTDDRTISDLEGRLREWESLLDRRLAEHHAPWRAEPPPPAAADRPPPAPPAVSSRWRQPFRRADATLQNWLEDLDHTMCAELALDRHPLPEGFRSPIEVVEDDQSMWKAMSQACGMDLSPHSNQLDAHDLGAFHFPGRGTLLNRAHYARDHGMVDFFDGNLEGRAELISEVARERWGWGFMLEYTTLGQSARDAGLWPVLSAARLGSRLPEDHRSALAAALRRTWLLTEAGWTDWVWQYVMFKARSPVGERLFDYPRPGRWVELANRIIDLFPLYISPFGVRLRLRSVIDLLKFLFLEEGDVLPRTTNSLVIAIQKYCQEYDGAVAGRIHQTLSQFMGRLYFARLESNVGILATPYAVLIATHVPELDLSNTPGAEHLQAQVEDNPRLNPDTRLAMLSKLDSRIKYDPRAMFVAAWERLKLDGPSGFLCH